MSKEKIVSLYIGIHMPAELKVMIDRLASQVALKPTTWARSKIIRYLEPPEKGVHPFPSRQQQEFLTKNVLGHVKPDGHRPEILMAVDPDYHQKYRAAASAAGLSLSSFGKYCLAHTVWFELIQPALKARRRGKAR